MAQDVAWTAAPRKWGRALRLAIGPRATLLSRRNRELDWRAASAEPRRSEPTRADPHWRLATGSPAPRRYRPQNSGQREPPP
eukprot:2877525-Pyramimonas_sp.AAC.1